MPEQSGDEVDRACDDDHVEHIRQDGVGKHTAPDLGVAQRSVGYLVGHADRESDVGKVAVAGSLLPVFGAERDAARLGPEVLVSTTQGIDGVDHGPRAAALEAAEARKIADALHPSMPSSKGEE